MSDYETITVTPMASAIGAEISGIDLSKPMDNRQAEEFHQAFVDHQVIFVRDQTLTPEQHKSLGSMFGELCETPFVKSLDGHPEIIEIIKEPEERGAYNFGGKWHTDLTFNQEPAIASVLYGLEVPKTGGDTVFASTAAAYETLSEGMRHMLDGMTAMHWGGRSYGNQGKYAKGAAPQTVMGINAEDDAGAEVEHPVVRVHPVTGRRSLYVNPNFTIRFKDMTEAESQPLLDFLYAHMTRDEFTCRFKWTPGSVAIWDNRATMHRAVNDYDGSRRVAHRVTIGGDRPQAVTAA